MKVQPLPNTGIGKILGLCEALDDRGGSDDIYKLAHDLQIEFGELLFAIKGGEILKLLNTPGADVTLEKLGKKVIEVEMNEKKAILRKQIESLALFQYFIQFLKKEPERAAPKEVILEELDQLLPSENSGVTFETLMNWGRYGEIFNYSQDTESFYLDSDYLSNE